MAMADVQPRSTNCFLFDDDLWSGCEAKGAVAWKTESVKASQRDLKRQLGIQATIQLIAMSYVSKRRETSLI